MKDKTKALLELAQAELAVAVQQMEVNPSVAYQHVHRAMKELKDAEYGLWHRFHTSGVPYQTT